MAATTLRGDLTMHPLFVKRAAAAKSSCSLLLALLLHLYHVCMTTQLKDLAARYGLEAIVGFFGAISTFKAPQQWEGHTLASVSTCPEQEASLLVLQSHTH
jgi:hypothetical protein